MRKRNALLLPLLLTLSLSACGSKTEMPAIPAESAPVKNEQTTSDTDTDSNADAQTGSKADAPADSNSDSSAEAEPILNFTTKDLEGTEVTMADYADAQVVMINFWEPWCGPCVGEMPELEKLYETYQDQGLVILGAFTTTDQMEDVEAIISDNGITYPILIATEEFYPYMSQYVPTTVFLDGEGKLLLHQQVIGAHSYEDWEKQVQDLLIR